MRRELRTSSESIELGYFDIEDAKRMVTWRSFKEQIEYCTHHKDPFVVEFNH